MSRRRHSTRFESGKRSCAELGLEGRWIRGYVDTSRKRWVKLWDRSEGIADV